MLVRAGTPEGGSCLTYLFWDTRIATDKRTHFSTAVCAPHHVISVHPHRHLIGFSQPLETLAPGSTVTLANLLLKQRADTAHEHVVVKSLVD
jgi:hypothetical protein